MNQTKAIMLSALLKQEKPFKASRIFQMTGLSRSLVRYHLDQFLSQGYLEKNGMYYAILERDKLINLVATESDDDGRIKLAKDTKFLDAELVNNHVRIVSALRHLKMPYSQEMKQVLIDEIDRTIRQLRIARTYLNEKSYGSSRTAFRMLADVGVEPGDVFDLHPYGLAAELSKSEFLELWEARAMELGE